MYPSWWPCAALPPRLPEGARPQYRGTSLADNEHRFWPAWMIA
ncbi:hypothetical protein HMPREF1316_2417 [Olsenella profusa F0195]|uniref:Uncharacterized protein n=1 Tax=Olsenella profusa F0195 TaxID=1125712 RepID=U2TWY0_9ACTN|nr:hypothetical protein HMPREF1316_2417 [Olsenella profusa F0195]